MADSSPFSTFGGLSASEIVTMQSGVPKRGSRPITPYDDDLLVPALACPGHAQPSASSFDPFFDTLNKEKKKDPSTRYRPSRQVRRDWPQQTFQTRPPRPYHQPQQRPLQQCPQRPPVLYPRQRPPSQRPPVLCPRQQPPARHPAIPTQSKPWQRSARPFPFKRECIRRIFKSLSEMPDSQLPAPVGPDQAVLDSHPYYCPYHQLMGHALEDCFNFKEWLRKAVTEGSVVLPAASLVDPLTSSESCASNSTGSSASNDDV